MLSTVESVLWFFEFKKGSWPVDGGMNYCYRKFGIRVYPDKILYKNKRYRRTAKKLIQLIKKNGLEN